MVDNLEVARTLLASFEEVEVIERALLFSTAASAFALVEIAEQLQQIAGDVDEIRNDVFRFVIEHSLEEERDV
jgi:hypothetical protein